MTTTDTFNVTAAYNQNSYTQGQTIVITISGNDVQTVTTTSNGTIGPLSLTVTAADGATEVLNVPQTNVTITTVNSTPESVTITGVVDNGTSPRTWTIAANKLSVSAVA